MVAKVITAMVTPFDGEGRLNLSEARRLGRWLKEHGSDGLLLAGTTGESPTLSEEEKLALCRAMKEDLGSELPLIAGVGTNDTRKTVSLAKSAAACGVDALLVVSPYYNKPPQKALVKHFTEVARAVSLPVIVYNIPGRTGVNILPETLREILQVPNITGLKDCSGSLSQATEFMLEIESSGRGSKASEDQRFYLYSGEDALTLPLLAVGAYGVISVASHLAGEDFQAMIKAFGGGEVEKAARIHLKLYPLIQALFMTTSPIMIKAALNLAGFRVGAPRPPLIEADEDQVLKLKKAVEEYGIFSGLLK